MRAENYTDDEMFGPYKEDAKPLPGEPTPNVLTLDDEIRKGISSKELSEKYNISPTGLYAWLKRFGVRKVTFSFLVWSNTGKPVGIIKRQDILNASKLEACQGRPKVS